jgi:hypothetical protein
VDQSRGKEVRKEGELRTHRMMSRHSSMPLGMPSRPRPPGSLTSLTDWKPLRQLGTPIDRSSGARYTRHTFVAAGVDRVGCERSGADTQTSEPRWSAAGRDRDHWRASSAAQEPPWAKPKQWIRLECQPHPCGVGLVKYSRTRVERASVFVGFGFWITAGKLGQQSEGEASERRDE